MGPNKNTRAMLVTPTTVAAVNPTPKGRMPKFFMAAKEVFNPNPAIATAKIYPDASAMRP